MYPLVTLTLLPLTGNTCKCVCSSHVDNFIFLVLFLSIQSKLISQLAHLLHESSLLYYRNNGRVGFGGGNVLVAIHFAGSY